MAPSPLVPVCAPNGSETAASVQIFRSGERSDRWPTTRYPVFLSEPLAVFFTFSTYGTHLHGEETGSVTRHLRNRGAPLVSPDRAWVRQSQSAMAEVEFTLDSADRVVVLQSVVRACEHRGWQLFCAHIRTNHVQLLLQPSGSVDRALAYLKARVTLSLKSRHPARERFWTKHGSTRYLWDHASIAKAIDYVLHEQGPPMQVFSERRA